MTDSPTPAAAPAPGPAQASSRSVVIETNSRVSVPKWPLWTALAAVVALAAFTAIWFVTRKDETYRPGPVVLALQESAAENDLNLVFSPSEARCIDKAAADNKVTAEMIENGGLDVLSDVVVEDDQKAFMGTMFDVCMTRESRSSVLAQGISEDSGLDSDQATCLGGALDDAIVENGGYAKFFDNPEEAMGVMTALFGALEECGIEFEDLMSL